MSANLTVLINGQTTTLPGPATLADAVALLQLKPPFAAAINLQFVPNTQYHHTLLQNADQIDLIAPVTGG
ncbi:MAG: thiamine biosynthesis protein ThiS [Comamonadaceae bacterium CG2_30_59_20]|nr:MAG: thiamine biosynthesis protein ThiS [Comamonadaceae bacterium CG2_30_59_20]